MVTKTICLKYPATAAVENKVEGQLRSIWDYMFKQISNIFQRIVYSEEELQSHIKPISFAIPEEVICENVPIKTKSFAYNIPGKQETYIYNNEIDYFKGYQESYFGITITVIVIFASEQYPTIHYPLLEVKPKNHFYSFYQFHF